MGNTKHQPQLDTIHDTYTRAQQTVMNAQRAFQKNPTTENLTAWANAQEMLSRTPEQPPLPFPFPTPVHPRTMYKVA
jgi:phosphohistidine phosphatase SixA